MSAELLRLAERVEGLTAGDRAVADEILLACGWIAGSNDEGEIVELVDPSGVSWSSFDLPDPTSSLDAAMSLVPEGHGWYVRENCSSDGDEIYCNAQVWPYANPRDDEAQRSWANTGKGLPALALTAASLRARAAAARGE